MNGKYKNYVWVTNGLDVHRVPKDRLDSYIESGYRLGKKKDGSRLSS